MKNKSSSLSNILVLALCELIVSGVTCAVFLLIGKYGLPVLLGVLLGSAVMVANFALLTVSIDRAIDKYMALRGTREMDEEEAEKFANQHAMEVQNAATRSFIVRTVSMLLTLVAAFIFTDLFSPIATAIPLLMFRPLLYVLELIKKKGEAKK